MKNTEGISRDSGHKRSKTGAKKAQLRKKRKHQLGRQPAMTKIGQTKVTKIRARGGNLKYRALRLDSGAFSWGSLSITKQTRILGVVYNATSNELVRTNTLVKGCIIQIDGAPFRKYYEKYFDTALGKTRMENHQKDDEESEKSEEDEPKEKTQQQIELDSLRKEIPKNLKDQFATGRLYAKVCSRPGQIGKCDGIILEGEELDFYVQKLKAKK